MASIKFKLSKAGRETRVLKFPGPPNWEPLSTRISSYFDIPVGKVAVSYEDNDGDMVTMSSRSWNYGAHLTGANALDVSRIAMDQALITTDISLLSDANKRSHTELVIQNAVRSDGIRADGAFGQHDGILYNGNYGKD